MSILYPLKFRPRLKARIWGGETLLARKEAHISRADKGQKIGESWDISCVSGDVSVVSNGRLKGNDLQELLSVYMGDLAGEKVFEKYGETFPLLIKSLDCNDLLSVQVHPDDELAAERHNSYGKTEMWYVADAKPGASLYVGFRDRNVTREEYLAAVAEGRLPSILNRVEARKGDVFFIPAGTVHALGAGLQVLEIQQTSDVTYRIYDWDRVDAEGRSRELHTALAVDAMDFSADPEKSIIRYETRPNEAVKMVSCKYFTTNVIELDGTYVRDCVAIDSFKIYMCTDGEARLTAGGHTEPLTAGESILVPAELDEVQIEGKGRLLEIYIE